MAGQTVVQIEFQANYHAGVSVAHPNEKRIEFPPSPYRFTRSLVSVWHLKAQNLISRETLSRLVQTLIESRLTYHLPDTTRGLTAGYESFSADAEGEKVTLLYDPFLRLRGPLELQWDVELGNDLREALQLLLNRLFYLGRSESLVRKAQIKDGPPKRPNCVPYEAGDAVVGDLFTLPTPWLGYPVKKIKEALAKQEEVHLQYGILELLEIAPATLRELKESPVTQEVTYMHMATPRMCKRRPKPRQSCNLASFRVLRKTHISEFLALANLIHKRLTAGYQVKGQTPLHEGLPIFSGKQDGVLLKDHTHSRILPVLDARGFLQRVLVVAEQGFELDAQQVLQNLYIGTRKGRLLQYEQLSSMADFKHPLLGKSKVWTSSTPFVSTLHRKNRVENGVVVGSAEYDLRRLLAQNGYPEPVSVTPLDAEAWQNLPISRSLEDQGSVGDGRRTKFRIHFPEEVQGPLALGYNSHFGLGLFTAD